MSLYNKLCNLLSPFGAGMIGSIWQVLKGRYMSAMEVFHRSKVPNIQALKGRNKYTAPSGLEKMLYKQDRTASHPDICRPFRTPNLEPVPPAFERGGQLGKLCNFSHIKSAKCFIGIIGSLVFFACQPKSYPKLLQSHEIALANPMIKIDSVLFFNEATISILPTQEKAVVRYTTDGSAVTASSPICPKPLVLHDHTDVQCQAFHPDFKPSEALLFSVRKIATIQPQITAHSTSPKAPYASKGLSALSNLQKGKINFRANQEWLGYQNETIELHLLFDESTYCKQLILSTLCDHNSWIFNPVKIELIQNDELIASQIMETPKANQPTALQFFDLSVAASLKEVTLKIYMEKIPDWHAGKGTTPWFFIDEIIVQ